MSLALAATPRASHSRIAPRTPRSTPSSPPGTRRTLPAARSASSRTARSRTPRLRHGVARARRADHAGHRCSTPGRCRSSSRRWRRRSRSSRGSSPTTIRSASTCRSCRPYADAIKVRHLLHHTSGLRDYNTLLSIAGRRDEDAWDNRAVLQMTARQTQLNFTPGDEYLYSNTGYTLLATIVERATGTTFAAFADANIFKPLGMSATHYHVDARAAGAGIARWRTRGRDGHWTLDTPINERAGAGGLYTSIPDLLKWDENFYTGRVGGAGAPEEAADARHAERRQDAGLRVGPADRRLPRPADRRAQRIARRLPRAPHPVSRRSTPRSRCCATRARSRRRRWRAASRTSSSAIASRARAGADAAGGAAGQHPRRRRRTRRPPGRQSRITPARTTATNRRARSRSRSTGEADAEARNRCRARR